MNSPLLTLLEGVRARAKASNTPVLDALRTVVNSPIIAEIVTVTPNPIDNLVLAFAKAMLPPTPPTNG